MSDELFIKRSAVPDPLTDEHLWRYTLVREWDESKPRLLMILLNPSTADQYNDDPTNRRGLGYAFDWGFGSLVFCNIFAFRTPEPKIMKAARDPIGPLNDTFIKVEASKADLIICGWG